MARPKRFSCACGIAFAHTSAGAKEAALAGTTEWPEQALGECEWLALEHGTCAQCGGRSAPIAAASSTAATRDARAVAYSDALVRPLSTIDNSTTTSPSNSTSDRIQTLFLGNTLRVKR